LGDFLGGFSLSLGNFFTKTSGHPDTTPQQLTSSCNSSLCRSLSRNNHNNKTVTTAAPAAAIIAASTTAEYKALKSRITFLATSVT